jgi:UDP-arabinose 4-epimerase
VRLLNVLVTGGAGFVGSHVCKALAGAGFCPVTFDNLSLGHPDFVKWGPLVEGDIRNYAALSEAIRSYKVVGLIHLAASAYVGESVTDPFLYYDNNVAGTLSVLTAMRLTGLRKIVFSSTCAVYGSTTADIISEHTTTDPINPYGRSKLMCELILSDFVEAYGFERIALRYFNASGADPEAEIGESREIETHLIPRAMLAVLGRIHDFALFGSDFPTPDGTAIRDYIHVSDLADAHVSSLNHLLDGHQGGCFNLGVGKGYSARQVLEMIAHVSGCPIQPPVGPRRQGDPARLVADARLAREVLGFAPKRSSIRFIVEDAWRWHTGKPRQAIRRPARTGEIRSVIGPSANDSAIG